MVEELAFSAARGACDDDQAAFFEAHVFVEVCEAYLGAFGEAVGVEVVEVVAEALHVGVAFGSDGAALAEFFSQCVWAKGYEAFVGILVWGVGGGVDAEVGDKDAVGGVEMFGQFV